MRKPFWERRNGGREEGQKRREGKSNGRTTGDKHTTDTSMEQAGRQAQGKCQTLQGQGSDVMGEGHLQPQQGDSEVSMPEPHHIGWSFKPACMDSEVSNNSIKGPGAKPLLGLASFLRP